MPAAAAVTGLAVEALHDRPQPDRRAAGDPAVEQGGEGWDVLLAVGVLVLELRDDLVAGHVGEAVGGEEAHGLAHAGTGDQAHDLGDELPAVVVLLGRVVDVAVAGGDEGAQELELARVAVRPEGETGVEQGGARGTHRAVVVLDDVLHAVGDVQEEARQREEPELRLRALGIGQRVVVSALEHVDHGVSETPALAFGEVVAFVAEGGHRGDDELHDVNVVDGRPARCVHRRGEGWAEGGEQGVHEPLLHLLPTPLLPAELEVAGDQLREPEEPMAAGVLEVLPVQPDRRGDAERRLLERLALAVRGVRGRAIHRGPGRSVVDVRG